MQFSKFIAAKRAGEAHREVELADFLASYLSGGVSDAQMSAWLMAVCFRGMVPSELIGWTDLMRRSGAQFRRGQSGAFRVDKHSTGGVGDKTSIVLVPLVNSVVRNNREYFTRPVEIPMVSGRALGFTGGTLDKLESVPGFTAAISLKLAEQLVADRGYCMMGQTEEFVPADKRLYALRDISGTVECLPLIVSSILSKKLAENLDALVLDVKFGRAAFMPDLPSAKALAESLVAVAAASGVRCTALLTRMDSPLGNSVGLLNEMIECESILAGQPGSEPLINLCVAIALEMLTAVLKKGVSRDQLETAIRAELTAGSAALEYRKMLEAQGANWPAYERLKLERASLGQAIEITADREGWIESIDARSCAEFLRARGGGREKASDLVDPCVGADFSVAPGQRIEKGQPLVRVQVRKNDNLIGLENSMRQWFTITPTAPVLASIVEGVIQA